MCRVDYDDVAHLYDEPSRDHAADDRLAAFLASRPGHCRTEVRVLDVCCGTGKQLAANRTAFPDIQLVGLDRSRGMLRIARSRCSPVHWIHGDASLMPFNSSSFDYVCNQFSYPHVHDKHALLAEIHRVLKPEGRFVMTNIDPWSMPEWCVYTFFPEARDLDHRDFLPVDDFVALMDDTGFDDVQVESRQVERSESLGDFLAFASERHRVSHFMTISDAAYQRGLARLRGAEAAGRDEPVQSDLVLVTVVGSKP